MWWGSWRGLLDGCEGGRGIWRVFLGFFSFVFFSPVEEIMHPVRHGGGRTERGAIVGFAQSTLLPLSNKRKNKCAG